jgi:hypothetical protein
MSSQKDQVNSSEIDVSSALLNIPKSPKKRQHTIHSTHAPHHVEAYDPSKSVLSGMVSFCV